MFFFFFNDTATTEIYTLSLHDALPILLTIIGSIYGMNIKLPIAERDDAFIWLVLLTLFIRSEEHTSELQSRIRISYAVFCLKKKTKKKSTSCYHTTHQSL
nr:CorA family divalent cation transporter [Enterococcus faecium]